MAANLSVNMIICSFCQDYASMFKICTFSIMCLLESQEAAFFIPGSQRRKIFLLFKSGEVVWHGQLLGLSVCGRFYKNSIKTWGCLLVHDKSSSNDGITLSYGLCMLQLAFVKVTSLSAFLS